MPFPPPPEQLVEYVIVHLVERKGGTKRCGFGSAAEAKGEADTLHMKGLQPHITKRWYSKKTWDEAPEFEQYYD
jgi:hypothetical protein